MKERGEGGREREKEKGRKRETEGGKITITWGLMELIL
jgi:hypothetical protein